MKLQTTEKIVGVRDRGLSTEDKREYANPEDRIHVLFDNTKEDESGKKIGHYVCNRGEKTFIVFSNQVSKLIKENGYEDEEEAIVVPQKLVIDDLLYTERTGPVELETIEQD
jgi:hypothetical protein